MLPHNAQHEGRWSEGPEGSQTTRLTDADRRSASCRSAEGNDRKLDEVEFADGTVWTREDVNAMESGTSGSAPFMSPMQLQAALDDFGASAPASLLSMSAMSEAMGPEDYAGAQLRMDVAVAGLAFDSADSDKVIDFSAVASSTNANALTVSMASENGLEKHFEV
ncbi:calcium-binding protein [Fretibacterium fastidiosum]|uniref:calcium-binding protein n=1 Tax=Fretibacterium fastidiosum TaxID=651822 RepID=UPI00311CB245